MRRFRTKQTLKFANLNNFGVSFSMQAVLGGGGNLELAPQGFRGVEKGLKKYYISDMLHHYRGKKAFTLAEVMITLGIIGIVAAMTMPALISLYQKK